MIINCNYKDKNKDFSETKANNVTCYKNSVALNC